ncbi:MAG: hypothetical protein WC979_02850 [Candidatus Pacearchaeota archaeon]|jgi:hypothetical protein|nr:hypothetical protein [Clostridia bacterium]
MKNRIPTFDSFEFVNEAAKKPLEIYICTSNLNGDIGRFLKGEPYIKKAAQYSPKKQYVYLTYANPNQEHYSDVEISDFESHFDLFTPEKYPAIAKQLNKWGLIEYGTEYYVISVSMGGVGKETIKGAIESALANRGNNYGSTTVSADSPKLALKKLSHDGGKVNEVAKDVFVIKMYSDWCFIVSTNNLFDMGSQKLVNYVIKSDVFSGKKYNK